MKHVLFILYTTSWLSWFAAGLLGPIYAIFVENIGGDILDAGIAWATFSIVMGVLTLIIGRFENKKFDRRKSVVLGYFILTMAMIGYLFVENPTTLLVVQAIIGIGAAINYPAWDTLFSHAVEKDKETTEWAGQEGGIQIIAGCAALAGSFVANKYGFATLFVVMSCVQAVGFFVSLHLLAKHHKHLKNVRRKVR